MSCTVKGNLSAAAVQNSVAGFIEEINRTLEAAGCPKDVRRQVDTAADEVMSNIVDYSGAGRMTLDYEVKGSRICLCFKDDGKPFNPLGASSPDLSVISSDGGFGIFLTRSLMDNLSYEYSGGLNALTLVKGW